MGAVVVLLIAALVAAVLVSLLSGRGRVEVVVPPTARASQMGVEPSGAGPSGAVAATTAPGASTGAPGASGAGRSPSSSGGSPAAPILVHVLGAVLRPGLYELQPGDRVVDAVAAAGGFTATADQAQQNLARTMADGEQLVIPEQGASPPLGSVGGSAASGTGPGGTAAGGPVALVNLNTADQATLETLPHVGPATAQRIIAWRTENGRFTQVDDLKNVTGIGDKTFESLSPLVTV